jgi:hypothetical protein
MKLRPDLLPRRLKTPPGWAKFDHLRGSKPILIYRRRMSRLVLIVKLSRAVIRVFESIKKMERSRTHAISNYLGEVQAGNY